MDIPKIYNDPVIFRRRKGNAISPFFSIRESMTVESYRVLLTENPNKLDKVLVSYKGEPLYESEDGHLSENTFKVEYHTGTMYFHESMEGKTLHFEYTGEGVFLYPDSRIYHTTDKAFPTVKDKLIDNDRALLVQKSRVDELIIKNPQPSEVVDMRIDYNGKIFTVAKDRLDAEQRKIEEAYVDAKNKKFPSLKTRIDSLQLATEEITDEHEDQITNIWASIDLIPGKISLETGKIESKFDNEVRKLTSRIDMIPEQISLKVEEVREWADGQFETNYSQIKLLSDEIELKVDANGVVNAINLSDEEITISGKRLNITADTHIGNAVIKSANIDSLEAAKIKTGVISSTNGNTKFNLDSGQLSMENTELIFGGGADIHFLDAGNRMYYNRIDSETGKVNSAGVGFGTSINSRFPFAFLGTTTTSRPSAFDDGNFTGFITNTHARSEVDDIGNSVIGKYFHVRDKAVSYSQGFKFDISSSTGVLYGMNTSRFDYQLGEAGNRFKRAYIDNIYGDHIMFAYPFSGSRLGYIMENTLPDENRNPAFRPRYGGDLYYNLGTSWHVWRHGYINTVHYNSLRQRSRRKFKEDINLINVEDALDYIRSTQVHTFYYKDRDDEQERTLYDLKVGIIYDDISIQKDYLIKSTDTTVDQSNIVYMIQAATKNILKRTESSEEKIERLENRINLLENENSMLKARMDKEVG